MTDERGGRYFREARFFLVGDKVVAQSHILDARSLMGYMRDMHALGGPSIQVKYATMQDGTVIKATMMNGQYQAEIVSPRLAPVAAEPRNIPTMAGYRYADGSDGTIVEAQAFKWQEGTGTVFLPFTEDYNTSYPLSVSEDGSMVAGKMLKYVTVGLSTTVEKSSWVYWDASNIPTLVPEAGYQYILDVQNKGTTLINAVPTILPIESTQSRFGLPAHRYAASGRHQYFGTVSGGAFEAAVVDTLADGTEVIGLHETGAPGGFSIINQADYSGNAMVGEYGTGSVVTWRRPAAGMPYVRAAVHADLTARSTPSCISGDGTVVGGAMIQSRSAGAIVDEIPVVWSEQYGLEQLEQFWELPGSTSPIIQTQTVGAITYDGRVAGGSEAFDPNPIVRAWTRGEDDTWGPTPGLSGAFFGICLVAN